MSFLRSNSESLPLFLLLLRFVWWLEEKINEKMHKGFQLGFRPQSMGKPFKSAELCGLFKQSIQSITEKVKIMSTVITEAFALF